MRVEIQTPLPPTVNHYYRNAAVPVRNATTGKIGIVRKRVLSDRAEAWMQGSALMARCALRVAGWVIPEAGDKVVVEIRVAWPDNRCRDMSNLHKAIADVLEGIAYVDDRYALLRDMDYRVSPRNPGLFLTVRPFAND